MNCKGWQRDNLTLHLWVALKVSLLRHSVSEPRHRDNQHPVDLYFISFPEWESCPTPWQQGEGAHYCSNQTYSYLHLYREKLTQPYNALQNRKPFSPAFISCNGEWSYMHKAPVRAQVHDRCCLLNVCIWSVKHLRRRTGNAMEVLCSRKQSKWQRFLTAMLIYKWDERNNKKLCITLFNSSYNSICMTICEAEFHYLAG